MSVEYINLSNEEIQRKLHEMNSSKAALERALRVKHKKQRKQIVQQVKDLIQGSGYDLDEIVPFLQRRRRGSAIEQPAEQQTTGRIRRYYVDPDNPSQTYARGVLPAWMKEKMQEKGYDHASKEDREAFKQTCMRLVES